MHGLDRNIWFIVSLAPTISAEKKSDPWTNVVDDPGYIMK